MYGHDIGADVLFTIDKTNGLTAVIGPTGFNANYAQGMDFDWSDDTLYLWLYSSVTQFCSADLTTGACTGLSTSNTEAEGFIDPRCTCRVYPISDSDGHYGVQTTVLIDASDANCDWTVEENLEWVSVSSTSGQGNGAITVTVDSNASLNRNGSITITGKNFSIDQASSVDITGDGCVYWDDLQHFFWNYSFNWFRPANACTQCDANCDGRIYYPDFWYFYSA